MLKGPWNRSNQTLRSLTRHLKYLFLHIVMGNQDIMVNHSIIASTKLTLYTKLHYPYCFDIDQVRPLLKWEISGYYKHVSLNKWRNKSSEHMFIWNFFDNLSLDLNALYIYIKFFSLQSLTIITVADNVTVKGIRLVVPNSSYVVLISYFYSIDSLLNGLKMCK